MQRTKNRGKNKVVAVLTALLLVTYLFPAAAFAVDNAVVTVGSPVVAAPEAGYEPGETFKVPVSIASNPGYVGAFFAMLYDADALELTGFDTEGTQFAKTGVMLDKNIPASAISFQDIVGAMTSQNNTGDGTLFYAEFTVKADAAGGTYPIATVAIARDLETMEFYAYEKGFVDCFADAVPTAYVAGSITVKSDDVVPVDPALISLGAVNGSYQSGETFTVPVSIMDNPGFSGASFTLGYDTDALEVTAVSATGALFAGGLIWDSAAPNNVGYFNEGGLADVTADGKLFDVTFTVKDAAAPSTYPLSLALTGSNANNFGNAAGKAVAVEFSAPVSVIVTAPPAPTPKVSLGAAAATAPGATFTVPVSIADNSGFYGAVFTLGYNTAALEITAVSAADGLFAGGLIWDSAAPANVGFFNEETEANVTADGKLFDVTFKVKDGTSVGSYPITLGLKDGNANNFADFEAVPVAVEFAGTTVSVPSSSDKALISVASSVDGYLGQEVVVPVSIANNPGFAVGGFRVNYDADALTFTGVTTTGSDFADLVVQKGNGDGVAFLNYGGASEPNASGDGVLFNLVFTVAPEATSGTSVVSLTNLTLGVLDEPNPPISVPVEAASGSVEVHDLLIPTAADLNYSLPQTFIYDGLQHAVTVTGKSPDLGAITVKYDDGTVVTTDPPTEAGVYTVKVDIAVGTGIYGPATDIVLGTLTISKAPAPTITWPTASAITFGQSLASVVLTPTSNSYGSFAWGSSVTLIDTPPAGSYNYPVVFTPSAATLNNYEPISVLTKDVTVVVNKAAAPSITWPTASAITYGATLATVVLTPASNSYGAFAFASSVDLSSTPAAGSHNYPVVFTPTQATLDNYLSIAPLTQDVTVVVNKAAAPTITWPTASDLYEGAALSASTLTGGSVAYGSFAWTDGTTIPAVPGGSYSVTFTPNASTLNNYEAITPTTRTVDVAVWAKGDLDRDGAVTSFDVLLHLRFLYGYVTASGIDVQLVDLDGDGSLTVADTILLLKKAADQL